MTSARGLRAGEALLALALLALGLFVAIRTAQMQVAPSYAAIGPRTFPFLVAGGLLVIGALLLREALVGHIEHDRGLELDWPAAGLVCVGLVLQFTLIMTLGWVLAATLMFVIVARAFASRRSQVDAALGVVLAGGTFAIFNWGLGLDLPAGALIDGLGGSPAD